MNKIMALLSTNQNAVILSCVLFAKKIPASCAGNISRMKRIVSISFPVPFFELSVVRCVEKSERVIENNLLNTFLEKMSFVTGARIYNIERNAAVMDQFLVTRVLRSFRNICQRITVMHCTACKKSHTPE